MTRLITFPAADVPPHPVLTSWMSHDESKHIDDRALFVISENEASAIVCYDSVFAHFLVICQGDPALCSAWVRRHFGDRLLDQNFEIDVTNSKACHYRGIATDTCLIWMKVPSARDGSLVFALLAHEAVHHAYATMELRGLKQSYDNEEFVAYYVQWVMNCYLQCIGLPSEGSQWVEKSCVGSAASDLTNLAI